MQRQFDLLRITRQNILNIVDGLSVEQLNKVPQGFNNSLAWNFGHVIITQQLLCYKLAGKELKINPDLVDIYRKGTKPEAPCSQAEFDYLKGMLFPTVDLVAEDYNNGIFDSYKEYGTSYNVTLKSIEDAIAFNTVHEGLHLGSMMAIKRNI